MSGDDSDGRIGLDAAIASLVYETDNDKKVTGATLADKRLHKHNSTPDDSDDPISKKKKESREESDKPNFQYNLSHGVIVADHYNKLEEKGLTERLKSRIFFMRNFNNWIKSMLINAYLDKVKNNKSLGAPLRVLDMGCGKGGDLFKWQKGNITHLICADIAEISVNQCETRFKENICISGKDRFAKKFTAEFITADCTTARLRERYNDPSVELDLVSCQFAFHYCFETLPQAECMLKNASECLREGGYFIGTIPDAYEIMRRKQLADKDSFGNKVYNIEFQCDESLPLFGAKYMFNLEGVVDCPEFLVHFPTLVKLAQRVGLQLVSKERFGELFDRQSEEGRFLLGKMQSLETYPPFPNTTLTSEDKADYEHGKKYMEDHGSADDQYKKIGTLSKSEWEATSLYLAFAFQKVKTSWNAEGKPVFNK